MYYLIQQTKHTASKVSAVNFHTTVHRELEHTKVIKV